MRYSKFDPNLVRSESCNGVIIYETMSQKMILVIFNDIPVTVKGQTCCETKPSVHKQVFLCRFKYILFFRAK